MHYRLRPIEEAIGISELCISFYSQPNISDGNFILVPHFNRTQIFQIDFSRLKKTYFDFLLNFIAKCKKKGTSSTLSNISPQKTGAQIFAKHNFYLQTWISPWKWSCWAMLFLAFFLGMVYIFTLQKIVAQRGRIHPFFLHLLLFWSNFLHWSHPIFFSVENLGHKELKRAANINWWIFLDEKRRFIFAIFCSFLFKGCP